MTKRLFQVGKIVNTHGISGEVRIQRITDFPDRFNVGNTLYLKQNNQLLPLTIARHRLHKQFDLLLFEGYNDIQDVEAFKGKYLHITEDQLTELDEGEYYYFEIIGCSVLTTDGDDIGIVDHILSPGANDVWVVKQDDGKEILIPYIDDVVKKVDVARKQIVIKPMEGLLE